MSLCLRYVFGVLLSFEFYCRIQINFKNDLNILVLLSMEFFCLLTFELYGRHTKVNCVLDLGCQRCPIDDMGVVVFM